MPLFGASATAMLQQLLLAALISQHDEPACPSTLFHSNDYMNILVRPCAVRVQADLASGLSVGAMVIPQGMSYAKLAGLPNVWGLYGAFVPVLVYAGLGSSRQLVSLGCAALQPCACSVS